MLAELAAQASAEQGAFLFDTDEGGGPGADRQGSGGVTFDRIAPCLLPEQNQVGQEWSGAVMAGEISASASPAVGRSWRCWGPCDKQHLSPATQHPPPQQMQVSAVRVTGPRYWHQLLEAPGAGGRSGRQGPSLAALYATRTLFVQRKAGALPYADDPSGELVWVAVVMGLEWPRGQVREPRGMDLDAWEWVGVLLLLAPAVVGLLPAQLPCPPHPRRCALAAEPHGAPPGHCCWRRATGRHCAGRCCRLV